MFRPIVGVVCLAWAPVESELFLAFAVAQPVESHVHCFCSLGLDFAVDDCVGHRIVCLDWGGGLFVAHLLEDDADVYGFSCHDVEGSEFGFGSRGHDVFDDVCDVENCSVVGGICCVV